jgi:putative ABC transport system permease protein
MFFTYLWRELRRRARQAIFIAIGLALGIGLVITVTAAAAGVKNAQASVLHSLYGVGTDITVTKAPTTSSTAGGGFGFSFKQSVGSATAPKAGSAINDNTLASDFTLSSISAADVTSISKLDNVAAAAGGLTLTDRTVTGTVPSFNTGSTSGGGGFGGGGGAGGGGSTGGGFTGGGTSSFKTNSFVVSGVDLGNGELGPLSTGTISSGRTFTSADATKDVALVDSSYATTNKLKVGSTIDIGNSKAAATKFTVVGIVTEPAGDDSTNVYIPLTVAQSLSGLKNDVNTIYVTAASGSDITSVANAITKSVSGVTITSQVTGSISSASSLANNLGKWLAIAVLIAAFLLASLLTMSAVSRRIREFGTLKALGWKSRRVVFQVMGESIAIGIVGGAIGVGLGFLGAAAVGHFAHPLTASLGTATTGSATPGGARAFTGAGGAGGTGGAGRGAGGFTGGFTHAAANAVPTVTEHLTAPVTLEAVLAAVILAVLGGLIAGSFGGWRAARLRPAAALSKVA